MRYCLLFVLLAASAAAQAQQWAAHLGVNMYYPAGTDLKGYHPVLWYTDAGSPKIRTGGFGASVTHQRPMGARMRMEYRLALQRHRYYDLATAFTDDNGSLLGGVAGVNTHWSAGVSAVPMLDFGAQRRWSVGLGLGLRANAFSVSNYGSAYVNGILVDLKVRNSSLAPVVVHVPLALSWRVGKHFTLSTRAEMGLTPASRLSAFRSERNVIWVTELGYRFGASE